VPFSSDILDGQKEFWPFCHDTGLVEAYDHQGLICACGRLTLEHYAHISDKSDQSIGVKLLAVLLVVLAIAALGGYVVYGSGMWNPVPQQKADY
jgi:hypothetical protein